jgi:5S rRNA maturation endonuclease (ribonuclease M5)
MKNNNGKISYHEYEEILRELEELRELSETSPIIVEGRKDEDALRGLGIAGKFFTVSNGIPFYEFCEDIAEGYREVILLTDLDREGHKLAKRLRSCLGQRGVRINEKFRLSLMHKLDTNEVENLDTRMKRITEELFRF